MPVARIRTALLAALLLLPAACSRGPSLQQQALQRLTALSRTAELGTVEYTVRKAVRARDEGEWFKIGNRRILFSCTAYIKAGIDLERLPLDKIVVDESTRSISLVLPHAAVLSHGHRSQRHSRGEGARHLRHPPRHPHETLRVGSGQDCLAQQHCLA